MTHFIWEEEWYKIKQKHVPCTGNYLQIAVSYIKYKIWQQITKKKVHKVLSLCFHTAPCTSHCHTCSEIPGVLQINLHASFPIYCSSTTFLSPVANTILLRLPHKYKYSSFKSGDTVGQASSSPHTVDIFNKHVSKWLLKGCEAPAYMNHMHNLVCRAIPCSSCGKRCWVKVMKNSPCHPGLEKEDLV